MCVAMDCKPFNGITPPTLIAHIVVQSHHFLKMTLMIVVDQHRDSANYHSIQACWDRSTLTEIEKFCQKIRTFSQSSPTLLLSEKKFLWTNYFRARKVIGLWIAYCVSSVMSVLKLYSEYQGKFDILTPYETRFYFTTAHVQAWLVDRPRLHLPLPSIQPSTISASFCSLACLVLANHLTLNIPSTIRLGSHTWFLIPVFTAAGIQEVSTNVRMTW
jgi:hypothetical protein